MIYNYRGGKKDASARVGHVSKVRASNILLVVKFFFAVNISSRSEPRTTVSMRNLGMLFNVFVHLKFRTSVCVAISFCPECWN